VVLGSITTLIGFVIASGGILVGVDTDVSNESGLSLTRPKYCQTGPRTVATFQGEVYFEHAGSGSAAPLYDLFRDTCAELQKSNRSRSVVSQAEEFAEKLTRSLAAHLARVPRAEFVRRIPGRVVTRVSVAGYDYSVAAVDVRGIAILGNAVDGWRAQSLKLSRLSFAQCGVRFQGEDAVVEALKTGTDRRLPPEEQQRPELSHLRNEDGPCVDHAAARALFLTALRLTVAHGPAFKIQEGAVGPPIDLIWIPQKGEVQTTRLPSLMGVPR
jgi:hypothetical protein